MDCLEFEEKLTEVIRLQSHIIDALYRELSQQIGVAAAELPCVADIERAAALMRELGAEP